MTPPLLATALLALMESFRGLPVSVGTDTTAPASCCALVRAKRTNTSALVLSLGREK